MRIACRRRALGKGHCSRPSLRRQRQRRKLSCSPSDRPRVQTAELMLSAGLAYPLLQFRITSVGPELTKRQAATKFWLFRLSNPTSGKRDILRRSASHIPINEKIFTNAAERWEGELLIYAVPSVQKLFIVKMAYFTPFFHKFFGDSRQ